MTIDAGTRGHVVRDAAPAGPQRSVQAAIRSVRSSASAPAFAAAALGAVFLLGSFVWLHLDHAVPVYDAGMHMWLSLGVRDGIEAGQLADWFTQWTNYPPLVHVVGALGMLVGGANPDAPVVANLLVFVPLLVAGCYVAGRVAYGPLAGVLAVMFALTSPMLVAQMRSFMLDAPEAALVAAGVAALLSSDRFARLWPSVLAGALCGLGLMTKQSFVAFAAGVVAVMLVRGGWRQRGGLLAFGAAALVVAGPWYLYHLDELRGLSHRATDVGPVSTEAGADNPPRWSDENLTWYWWSAVNLQLLAPLCLLALVGTLASLARFVRRRERSDYTPELVAGAVVGWLGMTWQFAHSPRYMLPATVFVAVLGVGWITRLPKPGLVLGVGVLAAVAVANTLGDTLGVGRPVFAQVGAEHPESQLRTGQVTLYSADGYQGVSAPRRQPDLLPILRALKATGARRIVVGEELASTSLSEAGLVALARFARLKNARALPLDLITPSDVYVRHAAPAGAPGQAPCVRLDRSTAVWFTRGNPDVPSPRFACPRG